MFNDLFGNLFQPTGPSAALAQEWARTAALFEKWGRDAEAKQARATAVSLSGGVL